MKQKETSELTSFISASLRTTLGKQTVQELKGLAQWINQPLNSRWRKEDRKSVV